MEAFDRQAGDGGCRDVQSDGRSWVHSGKQIASARSDAGATGTRGARSRAGAVGDGAFVVDLHVGVVEIEMPESDRAVGTAVGRVVGEIQFPGELPIRRVVDVDEGDVALWGGRIDGIGPERARAAPAAAVLGLLSARFVDLDVADVGVRGQPLDDDPVGDRVSSALEQDRLEDDEVVACDGTGGDRIGVVDVVAVAVVRCRLAERAADRAAGLRERIPGVRGGDAARPRAGRIARDLIVAGTAVAGRRPAFRGGVDTRATTSRARTGVRVARHLVPIFLGMPARKNDRVADIRRRNGCSSRPVHAVDEIGGAGRRAFAVGAGDVDFALNAAQGHIDVEAVVRASKPGAPDEVNAGTRSSPVDDEILPVDRERRAVLDEERVFDRAAGRRRNRGVEVPGRRGGEGGIHGPGVDEHGQVGRSATSIHVERATRDVD